MQSRAASNSIMTSKTALLLLTPLLICHAQQSGDEQVRTRQLWDTTLLAKRPAAPAKPAAKRPSSLVKGALVGITVWRLRPGKAGDQSGMRALVH